MSVSSPSAASSLSLRGLSLAFGGVKALSDVSFDVPAGAITALIGPNGAGKTSLFNCISGFYRPQAGRILFEGRDIGRVHPPARAQLGLARTFQNIALFRGMTVLDNIKLGRHVPPEHRPARRALLPRAVRGARRSSCGRDRGARSSISSRSTTSATRRSPRSPTGCRSGSSWRARSRCGPRC